MKVETNLTVDEIGIGTSAPNSELDVTGDVRISNYLALNCQNTVDPSGTSTSKPRAYIL